MEYRRCRELGARLFTDDVHRCELPSDAAVGVGGHPASRRAASGRVA